MASAMIHITLVSNRYKIKDPLNYMWLQFGTFEKFTYQAQQVNHEFKQNGGPTDSAHETEMGRTT